MCCGDDNKVEAIDDDDDQEIVADGKYGRRHKYDPEFSGPIKDRSCTDLFCLLLFIAFLIVWIGIGIYSFTRGNPERLIYPSDSNGDICGKGQYKDKPYLLFFDLSKCANPSVLISGCPTPQVCVAECPSSFERHYDDPNSDQSQIKRNMFPYCSSSMDEADITNDAITPNELIEKKICPPWWVPSSSFLKRCIPFFSTTDDDVEVDSSTVIVSSTRTMDGNEVTGGVIKKSVEHIGQLLDLRSYGEKIFNDLATSWWIVLLAYCFATVISLLWIVLMRYLAAVMVWTSLILSIILLIVSCVYCYMKYDSLKDVPDSEESWFDQGFSSNLSVYAELSSTWLILFLISLFAVIVVLILLIFLRKRIRIAIELIEEASIAVGDMMFTLVFPLVPFVLELIVFAWFIVVAMFLGSSGEQQFMVNAEGCSTSVPQGTECRNSVDGPLPPENVTTSCPDAYCEFYRYGNTEEMIWFQLYNLFGLLWGMFFITAFEEMVMAGAFATWYFTMDKKNIPKAPLLASLSRTVRYHLGTLAFGSLIIAIIRFIRLMIEYVEEKLKEANQDNAVVKCLLCCCRCCFWMLESFMKFINRNAFIMTAIYGKNFCWSAKESFSLLMRNVLRVFVLDKITDFLILLGKLVIVGVMGLLSFYIFSGRLGYVNKNDLNFYLLPVILITLGSYFIADTFFDIYEMAVDTLFLCFLEDIERNDGSEEKPYFMSKDLRRVLGYMNEKNDQD